MAMKPLLTIVGALAASVLLQGASCSVVPPPSYKLEEPRKALMVPPAPLPPVKAGEDLYEANRQLRGQYAVEASKAASLQRYVRTILKKQKGAP